MFLRPPGSCRRCVSAALRGSLVLRWRPTPLLLRDAPCTDRTTAQHKAQRMRWSKNKPLEAQWLASCAWSVCSAVSKGRRPLRRLFCVQHVAPKLTSGAGCHLRRGS
jgi:hypothetical protein